MTSLWLACCAGEDYLTIQREVEARDRGAHIVRFDDVAQLEHISAALEESVQGTALFAHATSAAMDIETVSTVARCKNVGCVVVVIDCLDPAYIAQLFHAGASEIVAAEGADSCSATSSLTACAGEEADRLRDDEPPFCMEGESGAPPATEASACDAQGASAERAPQVRTDEERERQKCDGEQPAWGREPSDPRPLAHGAQVEKTQSLSRHDRGRAVESTRDMNDSPGGRAPMVCAVSGKGGTGTSTVIASMAYYAAHCGLRTAVLDLDLMFGNLYELFGIDEPRDLEALAGASKDGVLAEADIVQASMRVAPGLTLWGPAGVPEYAELLGKPVEMLIDVLRGESDVIFVDTSATWTDAVAVAVGKCERCLMVCDGATGSETALKRAVAMVSRLGVARARMTCVVNRTESSSCTEEVAMRLEMAASLRSKMRIPDGAGELSALFSFGRIDEAIKGQSAFARSIRSVTRSLLHELGCPALLDDGVQMEGRDVERPRLHLPWKKLGEWQ